MSIQEKINRGISMSSLILNASPYFTEKANTREALEGMHAKRKALNEIIPKIEKGTKGTEDMAKTSEAFQLLGNPSEDFIKEIGNKFGDFTKFADDRIQTAQDLLDKFMEERDTLLGKNLTDKQKEELKDLGDIYVNQYQKFNDSSHKYEDAKNLFNENMAKLVTERDKRLEDERNNVEHTTSAPIEKKAEEEREVAPEVKAADSVLKAQQRSELYKKRMDVARAQLRKQYEAGEFDAYELGRAMAFNGLVGGDR